MPLRKDIRVRRHALEPAILYDDSLGITRCSACREPIQRNDASIEDDLFKGIRRIIVHCSFCSIVRVEESPLPCEGCTHCECGEGGNA